MINALKEIEQKHLKRMLTMPEIWDSLLVDYHPPVVERVFTKVGENRLSLHIIHSCEPDEALLHPHPWSAAFKVLNGHYRTGIGYSACEIVPSIVSETEVVGQMTYDMTHPDLWHYVAPITPVSTIMLNGPLFAQINPACKKADKELKRLPIKRKLEIIEHFKKLLE